jgi:hypothetical protein
MEFSARGEKIGDGSKIEHVLEGVKALSVIEVWPNPISAAGEGGRFLLQRGCFTASALFSPECEQMLARELLRNTVAAVLLIAALLAVADVLHVIGAPL